MIPEPAPSSLKPPGSHKQATHTPADSQRTRFLVWGSTILLLVMALVVIIILPDRVARQNPQEVIAEPQAREDIEQAPSLTLVAQKDAESALQAFLRLRAQSELDQVEVWAPERWPSIQGSVEEGDQHYGHRRFKAAETAYQAATEQLGALLQVRPTILNDSLSSARQALEKNDIESAIMAFERVLVMQGDHLQAQTGLKRARVRAQVLSLMQEGRQAQFSHQLDLADDRYRSVLTLDPNYQEAQSALQTVRGMLNELAFEKAMSQVLSSLQSGKLDEADTALKAARQIYPDHPALQDASLRLHNARLQTRLDKLRQQAKTLEVQERWREAADIYNQALGLDAQATFASTGIARAKTRLQLHDQLDHYLSRPDRLASDEPLSNARMLLNANPAPPENEPQLAGKLTTLKEAIRQATLPVQLIIESDSLTEVTIYHVGRLGTFVQKQLELRPGRYTVTGSRPGYRDVRKVVSLTPDHPVTTVPIRCEEPI